MHWAVRAEEKGFGDRPSVQYVQARSTSLQSFARMIYTVNSGPFLGNHKDLAGADKNIGSVRDSMAQLGEV